MTFPEKELFCKSCGGKICRKCCTCNLECNIDDEPFCEKCGPITTCSVDCGNRFHKDCEDRYADKYYIHSSFADHITQKLKDAINSIMEQHGLKYTGEAYSEIALGEILNDSMWKIFDEKDKICACCRFKLLQAKWDNNQSLEKGPR